MSEEELKKYVNQYFEKYMCVSFEKFLENWEETNQWIEQLQQENKSLKEKLDIAETNYDIIYGYFTQVNELLGTELCEDVLDEILKLKRNNNALEEFEKWLKKGIDQDIYLNNEMLFHEFCVIAIDKLQELKGSNNEKSKN